jgi:hypothetical protein
MADDSDPRRRRPPTTIDLKATEVASALGSAEAADPANETPGDKPAEAPKGWRPDWLHAGALRDRVAGLRPRWGSLRLIAAGVVGAAIMLAAFATLWASGMFTPNNDVEAFLAGRIAVLEQQVRELAAKPAAPAPDQRPLNELAARVTALEQMRDRLAGLDARIGKIESTAAAPRTATTDQSLVGRIAALEAATRPLADLGGRIDAAAAAARDAKARADAAFEAAQKTAAAPAAIASEQKDTAAIAARVATLEQALKGAQEQLARAGTGTDKPARLAFAALALRSAVEHGDPFARELAAAKLFADPALIAPLEPFAATGVPRAITLARELPGLATQMLAAATPAAPREGIFERLQQNAERLVRIRPVNEIPGDDPAAVISRAEVKASHLDLAGAIAELNRLSDNVRAPAQAWIKRAEAQVAALAAARKLAETSAAALAP